MRAVIFPSAISSKVTDLNRGPYLPRGHFKVDLKYSIFLFSFGPIGRRIDLNDSLLCEYVNQVVIIGVD